MANQTELEALVVKLEADTASFRSELLASQRSIVDASKKIETSMASMAQKSGSKLDDLAGMIKGTFGLFAAGGVVFAALEATKFAMEKIFEGESIRAAGAQFEMLAKNAGVAGEALKAGLMNAADGLVDDTDLIMTANKALVSMGSTAKDLPAVMELARKSTVLFGGDVATNFEAMSQAIASGQTRALKGMGIVVDSEAAYLKFARSIGVAKDELTEAGRQQALMNAVLETGKARFKDVDTLDISYYA